MDAPDGWAPARTATSGQSGVAETVWQRVWRRVGVLVGVLSSGAIVPLFYQRGPAGYFGTAGPDKMAQWCWLLLYGLAALTLGKTRRPAPLRWNAAWAIAVLALISALWADAPGTTLKRALGLAGTVLVASAMHRALGWRGALRAVADGIFLSVVASLVLVVVDPGLAHDPRVGGFRGVFSQKNVLGRAVVLGLVCDYAAGRARTPRRAIVYGIGLVVSASGTAIEATLLLAVLAVTGGATRRTRTLAFGIAHIALAGALVLVATGRFVSLLAWISGKSATLTNRTAIWDAVWPMAQEKPWLGWGFGSFWRAGGPQDQIQGSLHDWAHVIVHSHNGLLQLYIDLGLAGVVVGLWLLATLLAGALRDHGDKSIVLILGFFLIYNITETTLLTGNAAFTLVLLLGYLYARDTVRSVSADAPA